MLNVPNLQHEPQTSHMIHRVRSGIGPPMHRMILASFTQHMASCHGYSTPAATTMPYHPPPHTNESPKRPILRLMRRCTTTSEVRLLRHSHAYELSRYASHISNLNTLSTHTFTRWHRGDTYTLIRRRHPINRQTIPSTYTLIRRRHWCAHAQSVLMRV